MATILGWSAVRPGDDEVAVHRLFDGHGKDYFAGLWVLDDASGFIWIRAEGSEDRWLSVIEANPKIELQRRERSRRCIASIYDTPEARAYVAPWFRSKYGLAERGRAWRARRGTIPVRLQAR